MSGFLAPANFSLLAARREQLGHPREVDPASLAPGRIRLRAPPGEPHRQLRSRHVVTMLLDQLGELQLTIAFTAPASDL
jgi:hypothetical protein